MEGDVCTGPCSPKRCAGRAGQHLCTRFLRATKPRTTQLSWGVPHSGTFFTCTEMTSLSALMHLLHLCALLGRA